MSTSCASFRGLAWLAAFALSTVPAAAQLSDFDWESSGDPSGSWFVTESVMHIVGPAFEQCTTNDTWSYVTATAPTDGLVSAHLFFENNDGGFGWWVVEDAVYVINGVPTFLTTDVFDTWEGDAAFEVSAGDSFGFGVHSSDCYFGPGILDVTDFVFEPVLPAWDVLGNGLAGVAGTPGLEALGSLEAGTPWTISLMDGAPLAPCSLIVGTSLLEAPFKGGVLVPTPTMLVPMVTGPLGRITLDGDWPAGVPSGVPLVLQFWIVDAAGPAGFAASNGVSQVTP